jgi:hypothetical protein
MIKKKLIAGWSKAPKWQCPTCREWVNDTMGQRCGSCSNNGPDYNEVAIETEIQKDQRIELHEAQAIHRLLRGRQ